VKAFIKENFPALSNLVRRIKRYRIRLHLKKKKKRNEIITMSRLVDDLKAIGVKEGDLLIVHSSLSKMGYVENGAAGVVDACFNVIGASGTLVMPAFAHNTFSKIYLDTNPVFDIMNSPSKAGAVTEELRKRKNSIRSFHPTDAVVANGPLAAYLVKDHFGQITPYNSNSPYYRIAEKRGKILNVGVPLSTSCTNLHTLEDAVDFKYPVYYPHIYEVKMIDEKGRIKYMRTRVHDPAYSMKRRANELVPLFEKEGILKHGMIGEASATLIDAAGLFEVMLRNYHERGVTMYTPHGENVKA
jgi:aminoglycoside 3-N-acetyltransferase